MDQANDEFLLLGIASDNTTAHIHDSVRTALQQKLDYFDSDGFRQVPVFDPETGVTVYKRTGMADPDLVKSRLSTVLQHFAELIASKAVELEAAGVSTDEALNSLPDLTELTLDDAIKACFDMLGHPAHNVGSPFHNIVVHGLFG
jgi:hypothetical protein